MDISNFIKQQGDYLTAEKVLEIPAMTYTIIEEPTIFTNTFNNERLGIKIKDSANINETFDCSKTNARFIAKELGEDTTKWVGQVLGFGTYRIKTSKGETVDAIEVIQVIKKD